MISHSFINNGMASFMELNTYESFNSDIHARIEMYTEAVKEYEFMEELGGIDDSTKEHLVTEGGSILEAIGKFVMDLITKLRLMVNKFFDMFKSRETLDKEAIDIINDINKRNPGTGKKLYEAYQKGRAKVCDLRRIKLLDTGLDDILKYAMSKSAEPKTLREKINAYKTRIAEFDKSDVIKAGIAVGAAAGSINNVMKVIDWLKKGTKDIKEYQSKTELAGDKVMKAYTRMLSDSKMSPEYMDPTALSNKEIMTNLYQFYYNNYSAMIKAEAGSITKLRKELDDLTDKAKNANSYVSKTVYDDQVKRKSAKIKEETDKSISTLGRLKEDKRLYDLRKPDDDKNSKGNTK